jgi:hypothetical protein
MFLVPRALAHCSNGMAEHFIPSLLKKALRRPRKDYLLILWQTQSLRQYQRSKPLWMGSWKSFHHACSIDCHCGERGGDPVIIQFVQRLIAQRRQCA